MNESSGLTNIGMDKTGYSAGLTQVSKPVWQHYSKMPYINASNSVYWQQNLDVGASYLNDLHKEFGTWKLAMMAYNMGPGNLHKAMRGEKSVPEITKKYVQGID
jgi:soluble lytic murein transglycosylase-like protein